MAVRLHFEQAARQEHGLLEQAGKNFQKISQKQVEVSIGFQYSEGIAKAILDETAMERTWPRKKCSNFPAS